MGFDSKCGFASPTILLGLLLCAWMWGISSQLLQCLTSFWDFSDLGRGVSPQGCSSEAQPPFLTFDVGYLIGGHSKHILPVTQGNITQGHHQMINAKIRLIIFFAAKDGEALLQIYTASIQKFYTEASIQKFYTVIKNKTSS